jgi:hypothetical protein
MPAIQMPEHFQSSDLTALCRRVQKMRVYPENLHLAASLKISSFANTRTTIALLFDNMAENPRK